MIRAITITYIASSRLQDSRVREIEKARSRAWNRQLKSSFSLLFIYSSGSSRLIESMPVFFFFFAILNSGAVTFFFKVTPSLIQVH